MNIRFDNEINVQSENNIPVAGHSINVKEANITRMSKSVNYTKNDNNSFMNAYQDKENLQPHNAIANASTKKDYMVLMSNTVSDEDYKKLQDNGFNPGSMTPEETVTVVDEIKATMAKSGNVIAGYNDDLDKEKLAEITGSAAYANSLANTSKVELTKQDYFEDNPELKNSFNKYDVPLTDANVNEAIAALNMAMQLNTLSDGALKYMTENNLAPTVENVYLASHNGTGVSQSQGGYFMDANGYLGRKSEAAMDETVKNQVKGIIEESGLITTNQTIEDAFKMIEDGMTLTPESFARYEELKNLQLPLDREDIADKIAMNIKDGGRAKNTSLTQDKPLIDKAKELVDEISNISDEAVQKVHDEGKPFNIRNLSMAQRTITANISITAVSVTASSAGYRMTLSQVKISMSISSTYMLMKNGIDVYNEDLNMLSEELKEAGNRQFESLFGEEFSVDKAALKDLFEEATGKVSEIKNMPVATLGLMSLRNAFSLNTLYEEGRTLQNRYITAGEKYEPLMTEVRSDLGDSIKKAFSNVQDILSEMGMDITDDNERAVRILGYSNQDINLESVDVVKQVYEKVHNVISKMTPAKTLELIREGVNPLEVSLDELEEKLDMNPLSPVEEAERYSHFLYRMEHSGQITDDEKESFIGIYRMINAIEKNDSAAIGTLIASNGEINFKNLVSAVRTRQNKGIDAKIDDEFGALEKLNFKDASITDQIEKAFAGKEILSSNRYDDIEKQYISEVANVIRENGDIKDDILNLLINNNLATTTDNLLSAKDITLNRGKIYRDIAKLSEKSTLSSKNVDKNVENQAENNDNVENVADFSTEALDELTEALTDKDTFANAFSNVLDDVDAFLNKESLKAGSFIDVRDILTSMKRMGVIRNLANNECYEVPAYIDGELSSVRVSVLHEKSKIPNVNLSLETESFGKVSASFAYVSSKIEGMIVCESESGISRVKSIEKSFADRVTSLIGMEISRISYFKSSNTDVNYYAGRADKLISTEENTSNGFEENEGKDAISTKTLYTVAKELIKTFA